MLDKRSLHSQCKIQDAGSLRSLMQDTRSWILDKSSLRSRCRMLDNGRSAPDTGCRMQDKNIHRVKML
ncbi:MAG: hypothetical protein M0Q38_01735 [Bacteroidales bacterium]|nr:hypothetical protein [Bacteroidales bacterium]